MTTNGFLFALGIAAIIAVMIIVINHEVIFGKFKKDVNSQD